MLRRRQRRTMSPKSTWTILLPVNWPLFKRRLSSWIWNPLRSATVCTPWPTCSATSLQTSVYIMIPTVVRMYQLFWATLYIFWEDDKFFSVVIICYNYFFHLIQFHLVRSAATWWILHTHELKKEHLVQKRRYFFHHVFDAFPLMISIAILVVLLSICSFFDQLLHPPVHHHHQTEF